MKYELKIEYENTEELLTVIKLSYDEKGILKPLKKKDYIKIDKNNLYYGVLKGLNNTIVRVYCEIIDGYLRCVVEEGETTKLYPISKYCIVDGNYYQFY